MAKAKEGKVAGAKGGKSLGVKVQKDKFKKSKPSAPQPLSPSASQPISPSASEGSQKKKKKKRKPNLKDRLKKRGIQYSGPKSSAPSSPSLKPSTPSPAASKSAGKPKSSASKPSGGKSTAPKQPATSANKKTEKRKEGGSSPQPPESKKFKAKGVEGGKERKVPEGTKGSKDKGGKVLSPTAPMSCSSNPKTQQLKEILRQKMAQTQEAESQSHQSPSPRGLAPGPQRARGADGGKGSDAADASDTKLKAPNISSNWLAMKTQMKQDKKSGKKAKPQTAGDKGKVTESIPRGKGTEGSPGYIIPEGDLSTFPAPLAVDCEMVGIGETGKSSALARVSIVDRNGEVVLDTYVAPQEKVTDFRTKVSGIRPQNLKSAPQFKRIQKIVSDITKNKILLGHAIENDLKALLLVHPKHLVRDTAKYRPFQSLQKKSRKLRDLAEEFLGLTIQTDEHSSVEDARATLLLYKHVQASWEKALAAKAAQLERIKGKKKGKKP